MENICKVFPSYIKEEVLRFKKNEVEEIRIKINSPVFLYAKDGEHVLCHNGMVVIATKEDIDYILRSATGNSLYAYSEDIKNGFITVKGGHRIGVSGRMVYDNKSTLAVKDISGLNIRISGRGKKVGNSVIDFVYKDGCLKNTLIVSPPKCGKTTLLRDLIRIASDVKKERVVLIDERDELASSHDGICSCDVGKRTLVLSGYSKRDGFSHGIRGLSPTLIACDEIGGKEDREILFDGIKKGVRIIATLHGEAEFLNKYPETQLFERIIVLDKDFSPSFFERRGGVFYEL